MASTIAIRNLDDAVKQKLRVRAAIHGHSMEAEAREVLTRSTADVADWSSPPGVGGKFDHLVGLWKGRMTTDELMQITRD